MRKMADPEQNLQLRDQSVQWPNLGLPLGKGKAMVAYPARKISRQDDHSACHCCSVRVLASLDPAVSRTELKSQDELLSRQVGKFGRLGPEASSNLLHCRRIFGAQHEVS